jgi:peptidoglycan/LPS O-acetylase OafA/YrhL
MVQLDALRCFAVLGVVANHTWQASPLPWIFVGLDTGHLGVELFFVLSGFLITGILLECRERAEASGAGSRFFVKRFYIRRFLRIFPIYYLTILVLFLLNFERVRELAPWLFSYTSNLNISLHGQWIGDIGHFWSLAVEEQFYLVWPWLILFLPRRWLVPIVLVMISLGFTWRVAVAALNPNDLQPGLFTSDTFTIAPWDSLGAGALLALLWRRKPDGPQVIRRRLRAVLPFAIAGSLAGLAIDFYIWPWRAWFVIGDIFVGLIFCWLIAGAGAGLGGIGGRVLTWWPLVYVGTISYAVYLFHPIIKVYLTRISQRVGIDLPIPGFELFVLTSVLSVAAAGLSWRFFEGPINDLKRHFGYSLRSAKRSAGHGTGVSAPVEN